MNYNRIILASDHAGYLVKTFISSYLKKLKYNIIDVGTNSEESVDYPDFAHALANKLETNDIGIAVCGSGNGISMALNRHLNVRAALCWNQEIAQLAKLHNNANVCVIPGRFVSLNETEKIIETFLNNSFEGGRHINRVEKINLLG